jgi:hypothetical protein
MVFFLSSFVFIVRSSLTRSIVSKCDLGHELGRQTRVYTIEFQEKFNPVLSVLHVYLIVCTFFCVQNCHKLWRQVTRMCTKLNSRKEKKFNPMLVVCLILYAYILCSSFRVDQDWLLLFPIFPIQKCYFTFCLSMSGCERLQLEMRFLQLCCCRFCQFHVRRRRRWWWW